MALKRKAQEAFERPQGQISAFAASKLARQSRSSSPSRSYEVESITNGNALAVEAATTPYDGHHSGAVTPNTASIEDEAVLTTPSRLQRAPLSTFVLTTSNLVKEDEESLEIRLKRDETITFIGEYDVSVLGNHSAINIAGTLIQSRHGSSRVYATSIHALPQIRSLSDGTVIRVSSVRSGLTRLERLSPLFRNIWSSKVHGGRSFALLESSEDDSPRLSLNVLEIDKDMDVLLRALSAKSNANAKNPRIMAIGAKSSGKSTINRLLCNYIHTFTDGNKLLYLDLDPGQPEFGPPGQISLVEVSAPILGPPLTHLTSSRSNDFRLIRSHTIAATHFKDDPEHYEACVVDLIGYVDTSHPVIVNSCGWTTGIGGSVLVDLVSMLKITDAILLEPLEESLVTSLNNESPNLEFHRISRRAVKPPSRTPAEVRAMQTMSYFHYRAGSTVFQSRWSGKSISKIRPWIVSYAGENAGITAVMSYGPSPDPTFLAEVLDGSIVAIATLDPGGVTPFLREDIIGAPGTSIQRLEDSIDRTPEDIPYILPNEEGISRKLNPSTSQCLGLVLMRGIDTERKEVHLVTPLSEDQIANLSTQQVILVRGSFDPPEWAYLEDVFKDDDGGSNDYDAAERPWVSEKSMAGIEGSVWRLRHPPVASAGAASR